VVRVPLGDGTSGFGVVLDEPLMTFLNLRLAEDPTDSQLAKSQALFAIWVMNYAVTDGIWPIIGLISLSEDMMRQPNFFKEDKINGRFYVWPHGGMSPRESTFEEVKDL